MPNGIQTGAARPPGEPQPAPGQGGERRELHSWWKQFRHRGGRKEDEKSQQLPTGIFGVALQDSIRYANVAISLYDPEGNSYIYGYVPIVVAKCGVYLKEKATEVEGIFRLSGSEKRIKELKLAFDSPDRYGKGLNWEGFTVHDAANILRRYFNQLPEPIVPLDFYDRFRQPLQGHQEQAVGPIDGQAPSVGDFDGDGAIRRYQELITELPPLNRQLLLYILDLLAVFASKSDLNKMTTPNLAAIFQPGLISHPMHDMAPAEYRLSQDVLIFLIENQDHFLIGMQGTEADAKTVQEVESGPPTPQAHTPTTPARAKTVLGRSGSQSSVGADSVRKFGGIRRNVSVSSRHSRNSSGVSPITPSFQGGQISPGTTGSGVHRSNTMPSTKRSPGLPSARFGRDHGSGPSTPPIAGSTPPTVEEPTTEAAPAATQPQVIIAPTEAAPPPDFAISSPPGAFPVTPLAEEPPRLEEAQGDLPSPLETPTSPESSVSKTIANIGGNIGGLFARSPSTEPKDPLRKPNKLQKKSRMPGSAGPSPHGSTHSLAGTGSVHDGPPSPYPPGSTHTTPQKDQTLHPSGPTEGRPQQAGVSGATLRPTVSPSHSFRSHSTATDVDPSASEAEGEKFDDRTPIAAPEETNAEKSEKKRRWNLKHSKDGFAKKVESASTPTPAARENTMSTLGSNPTAGRSHSSINSFGDSSAPRKSFQGASDTEQHFQGDDKDRKGTGPVSWFRGKLQERQERKEEKARAKSPPSGPIRGGEGQPGSMLSLNSSPPRDQQGQGMPVRDRSFDAQRELVSAPSQPQAPAQGQPQPQPQPQPQAEDAQRRANEVVLQAFGPSSKPEPGTQ